MSMANANKKMMKQFKFFDIVLAETYHIVKVRSFTFGNKIEIIFTLRSNDVDNVLKAYATVNNATTCKCRSELVEDHDIWMSNQAKEFIRTRIERVAIFIGRTLISGEVGEYAKLSYR